MNYAGIGSRGTPTHVLDIMGRSAEALARMGYCLRTGACIGADQAFAKGALRGYGRVVLCLPWSNYEKSWIRGLHGDIHLEVLDTRVHTEAVDSVKKFHPNPAALKQSVIKLHARNYLILNGVQFVICWTPNGEVTGGTGQAIRIAQSRGIKIYNLGDPNTLAAFEKRLEVLS